MYSDKESELMDEAAAIRVLYPPGCAPKRVARLMDVPLGTAREWCYRRVSSARRRELTAALLAECRRRGEELSALERWLATKASE